MKLLTDLQLSVVTRYDDGEFLFSTDSNVDVASMLLRDLVEYRPTYDIAILVPRQAKLAKSSIPVREQFHGQVPRSVRLLPVDMYGDPFVERQCFDARGLAAVLASWGFPDVVYTNDPCKVLAYKTLLYRLTGRVVPVIARWHWVSGRTDRKVPVPIDFAIRHGEAALAATACFFDSKFAVEQFLWNMSEYFRDEQVDAMREKIRVSVAVDIQKIDIARPRDHRINRGRPTVADPLLVAWCHRLSYYTGWREVFDALRAPWDRRGDFRVIVTDPGNKRGQVDLAVEWPFILPIDRSAWTLDDYLRLCWHADVVIGNHSVPAIWGGLALTEPMAAMTAPLMPARWAYEEMCSADMRSAALFDDISDMVGMFDQLVDNLELLTAQKVRARAFCEASLSPRRLTEAIVTEVDRACT